MDERATGRSAVSGPRFGGLALRVIALVLLVLGAAGCPKPPGPPDGGPPGDGGPPVPDAGDGAGDDDGDGLCNATERSMGTDPENTDSDSDGLDDRVEVELGYRPLQPDSPQRDVLVFMQETEIASQQLTIPLIVNGGGHTYTGAFEALSVFDTLDLTAMDLLEEASAVGAMPMENVFEVMVPEQRFVDVQGRTQLFWELRFAFGDNLPRSCIRAYPFRYQVKRDDGYFVLYDRYLLVILPEGQRLDTAEWCRPPGDCI
ncbi:MAG: hypothetical protein AB7S26_03890 [Sandaracinaceae bacterium]